MMTVSHPDNRVARSIYFDSSSVNTGRAVAFSTHICSIPFLTYLAGIAATMPSSCFPYMRSAVQFQFGMFRNIPEIVIKSQQGGIPSDRHRGRQEIDRPAGQLLLSQVNAHPGGQDMVGNLGFDAADAGDDRFDLPEERFVRYMGQNFLDDNPCDEYLFVLKYLIEFPYYAYPLDTSDGCDIIGVWHDLSFQEHCVSSERVSRARTNAAST
ncbi:MAG: hypothetical protein ABIF71_14185 [Planctomycetota bacterium]